MNPKFALDRSRLPADVCEFLRTKTMYTGGGRRAVFSETDQFDTAAFWCLHTQMPWGPDELEAAPDVCRGARTCCKPCFVPPAV